MIAKVTGGAAGEVTGALIGRLASELRPVRRLARPGQRAAAWLALVVLAAVLLATRVDMAAVTARISVWPDMWLAALGSAATAVTAAVAALMLALPDRDRRWALLPLPPLALWLIASGAGCLRQDVAGLLHPASLQDSVSDCLPSILTMSLLLGLPFGLLVWRAQPLHIASVAWTGGLAIAAASASLLWLNHPFDAGLTDFLVHAAAVALVMAGFRVVSLLLPE